MEQKQDKYVIKDISEIVDKDNYTINNTVEDDYKVSFFKKNNEKFETSIDKKHFNTMNSKEWFLDVIIDNYVSLLQNWRKSSNINISLTSFLISQTQTLDVSTKKFSIDPTFDDQAFNNLHDNNIILFPFYNNMKNHFILNVIDLNKNSKIATLYHINPLGPGNYFNIYRVVQWFKRICSDFNLDYTLVYNYADYPVFQKDGYNCGPYICLLIRLIMFDGKFDIKKIDGIDRINMDIFRKLMRAEFLTGAIHDVKDIKNSDTYTFPEIDKETYLNIISAGNNYRDPKIPEKKN